MAKTINTVLALKDKFSAGVKKAADNAKNMDRKTKMASNTVKKFGRDMNNMAISAVKNTAKAAGALGALATGVGFKEAFDLEGYKLQLETATKDTKKAAEIMKFSIQLANKTPFEGGQLVEGAAQFEAMGMSAKKWLPLAGDMAAATNKDFMQATEALIDAQGGELERLKEFGIKKEAIVKYAYEKMGKIQVVNNQGQITNQEKFNEALVALMEDKFKGGMEKQATTVKGLWSTVTGVTKSSLATIVGITEEGSIRQGSALEMLKGKIKLVADQLTAWQSDGTLDEISNKVTGVVTTAFNGLSASIKWCKDNMDWLIPVASGLATTFVTFNIISTVAGWFKTLVSVTKTLNTVTGIMNVTMSLNPFALTALAIGATVAAGVLLIKNWDKIIAKAKEVAQNIKNVFTGNWESKVVDNKVPKAYQKGKTAPRHATGTSYFAGGETRINEGGRGEMAVLPSGSKIIPADKTNKAMSGKTEIKVNVEIQGNVVGNSEFADEVGETVAKKLILVLDNM